MAVSSPLMGASMRASRPQTACPTGQATKPYQSPQGAPPGASISLPSVHWTLTELAEVSSPPPWVHSFLRAPDLMRLLLGQIFPAVPVAPVARVGRHDRGCTLPVGALELDAVEGRVVAAALVALHLHAVAGGEAVLGAIPGALPVAPVAVVDRDGVAQVGALRAGGDAVDGHRGPVGPVDAEPDRPPAGRVEQQGELDVGVGGGEVAAVDVPRWRRTGRPGRRPPPGARRGRRPGCCRSSCGRWPSACRRGCPGSRGR